MARAFECRAGLFLLLCNSLPAFTDQQIEGPYIATAYAQQGVTASGEFDPPVSPQQTTAPRLSAMNAVTDLNGVPRLSTDATVNLTGFRAGRPVTFRAMGVS